MAENPCALAARIEPLPTSEACIRTPTRNWSIQDLRKHAVQCRLCGKYRRVPEKRRYEEIRQQVLSNPWECSCASEWTTEEISCDVPEEFTSPEFVLLFDKSAIPVSPPLWERECFLSKQYFADIYYYPPNGGARIKSKRYHEMRESQDSRNSLQKRRVVFESQYLS
ncbi:hypothetical protein Mapa_009918 [Marchantia paleacea]|nr:hypothetical protein Mapa_009918 [Marchantia paleacea]